MADVDSLLPKRQRRWATRVKSGCRTCRNRRIKCDELRPVCSQCIKARRECVRYDMTVTHDTLIKAAPLFRLLAGPNEDLVEGFRYFVTTMVPHHLQVQHAENAWDEFWTPKKTISDIRSVPSFLMIMMSHRIWTSTSTTKNMLVPGAVAHLQTTWQKYFDYMAQSIQEVNQSIEEGKSMRMIFNGIVDLLSCEIGKPGSFWCGHINGFGVLIKAHGGVDAVLQSDTAPASLGIQFVLIFWIIGNSTSPSNDQMSGFSDWTDDEVRRIYSEALFFALECPTILFLCILRINRLRALAASEMPDRHQINHAAAQILATINQFDPETWVEPYPIPEEPYYVRLAYLFKTAVALYAVCSLPQSILESLQMNIGPKDLRSLLRSQLLLHIQAFLQVSKILSTLPWPLAVLGFAMADGSAADRAAVVDIVQQLCKSRYIGPQGSTMLLERLQRFWASGKTQWDECFDEPCILLDP